MQSKALIASLMLASTTVSAQFMAQNNVYGDNRNQYPNCTFSAVQICNLPANEVPLLPFTLGTGASTTVIDYALLQSICVQGGAFETNPAGSNDQTVQLAYNLIPAIQSIANGADGNVGGAFAFIQTAQQVLTTYPVFSYPDLQGEPQLLLENTGIYLFQYVYGISGMYQCYPGEPIISLPSKTPLPTTPAPTTTPCVTPQITSITPAPATLSTPITITGTGFLNQPDVVLLDSAANQYNCNDQTTTVNADSTTTIVCTLPSAIIGNNFNVYLYNGCATSSAFVLPTKVITIPPPSDICSFIYQEGAQDHTCNVAFADGTYESQCYNPACYTCTSNNQLCPTSAPSVCGFNQCYDSGLFTCTNGTLAGIPNGNATSVLPFFCPGSGSILAGTDPSMLTLPCPTLPQSAPIALPPVTATGPIKSGASCVYTQNSFAAENTPAAHWPCPSLILGSESFNSTQLDQIMALGSGVGSTDQAIQLAYNLIPALENVCNICGNTTNLNTPCVAAGGMAIGQYIQAAQRVLAAAEPFTHPTLECQPELFAENTASALFLYNNGQLLTTPSACADEVVAPSTSTGNEIACPSTCGPQDGVCFVADALRAEAPWHNSTLAYPQCYNKNTHICSTSQRFLCPLTAPYVCGRNCYNATEYHCVDNVLTQGAAPALTGNPTKLIATQTTTAAPVAVKATSSGEAVTVSIVAMSAVMIVALAM